MYDVKFTREDLKGLSMEEIQNKMAEAVAEFEAEFATKSSEELREIESQLMENFDENDKYIAAREYTLGNETEYDDKMYKANDVHKKIISFLNRIEVDWKSTLGIYQGVKFWKTIKDGKVPYAVYDNTLRLLGLIKFKGEQDCLDILVVNAYMSSIHAEYMIDIAYLSYMSAIHNAMLQALEKVAKAVASDVEAE